MYCCQIKCYIYINKTSINIYCHYGDVYILFLLNVETILMPGT